jgi:Sulfotransferase family
MAASPEGKVRRQRPYPVRLVRGVWRRATGKHRRRHPEEAPDSQTPAVFVVGDMRSGTTLLRLMLDAHPELAIPPETHFVPQAVTLWERGGGADAVLEAMTGSRRWGDFEFEGDELRRRFEAIEPFTVREALRSFYALYAERHGKPRWGDKTPGYVVKMTTIHRALPEARFVHLIRDGRDVMLSRAGRSARDVAPQRVAKRWKNRILKARKQGERVPHYLEVRYEDLVSEPEATLRRICEFAELDFDPAMLDYHERAEERLQEIAKDLPAVGGRAVRKGELRLASHALAKEPPRKDRVARWKRQMDPEDRLLFEDVAGDLLEDLGYEVGMMEMER